MSDLTRRDFLQTAAGAAALLAAPSALTAAHKKIPIGVQLYSVRDFIKNDVPGTLASIKKLGYDGVEFAGYYDLDAKALRKILDDNGLKACGTHITVQTLLGDQLEKTVEFNRILGNRFLIVPSLRAKTLDDWAKQAETFNQIAEKLKPHKMRVGYHNHTQEFQAIDGQRPMDVFFGKTTKDVIMQLDIGHCVHGGGDPVAYLKKYPGRALTVHVKEWSDTKKDATVGEGDVKWPAVLQACETVGGTEWYVIEEETEAYKGVDGIDKCIKGLKKLLA